MRRAEVLATFQVVGERIVSPGPFEGQPLYVPYFWDKALDGWADAETEEGDPIFLVMPEDAAEFPELRFKTSLRLHENDQGLVCELPVDKLSTD